MNYQASVVVCAYIYIYAVNFVHVYQQMYLNISIYITYTYWGWRMMGSSSGVCSSTPLCIVAGHWQITPYAYTHTASNTTQAHTHTPQEICCITHIHVMRVCV